jgi:hypothetical protein
MSWTEAESIELNIEDQALRSYDLASQSTPSPSLPSALTQQVVSLSQPFLGVADRAY